MKKTLNPVFLLLFLLLAANSYAQLDRSKIPPAGPAPVIQLGKYESFTLKNGLKVFVVENHKLPRVAFSMVLDYDPILEKAAAGYVSIAGQLMRTGTKTRTKDQLDEEIDFIAASLSTSATGAYGSSLKKHQDKLLSLLSDVVLNPNFTQSELDKLKKQTKSGIASRKDDPESVAELVSNVVLYGKNHPYGEYETEASIDKINLARIKAFYTTYYKPNIAYLAVVGDITLAEAKTAVEKYFGKWQPGSVPKAPYPVPASPVKTQVALVDRPDAVQTVLDIKHTINLKPGSPDAIKVRVTNDLLGGQGGRLFTNLREKHGYTYGAYSSLSADKLIGEFTASASARTAVTDSALVEFFNELRKIREEKVSPEELKRSKSGIMGSFARSLESPQTIASFAINTARYKLPADYYRNYLRKLDSVTIEDVGVIAKKYIHPDHATIIAVGKGAEIGDKLQQFGPITYYDAEGNKVTAPSATKAVIPAGVTAETVLDNYVKVIGGKANLEKIQDLTMTMSATIQGTPLTIVQQKKAPNKVLMSINAQGMEVQKTVSNGAKATMSAMGQTQQIEGKQMEATTLIEALNLELVYDKLGIRKQLTGMEKINGKETYKIEFTLPGGDKFYDYYDATTGFRLRRVSTLETPQGSINRTTDYDNYKEVNGVKFPFTVSQSAGPQQIKMDVQSIEINKGLKDEIFEVK